MNTEYIKKEDSRYPLRMKQLPGMPKGIYVKGRLPQNQVPTAAIVGARSCSNYGRNMAQEYARILSREGVQVISGLALGIDGEAHAGALQGNTATFAVLANDVEQCYPRSHQKLYNRILENGGGIIGEQPPGTPALARYFPARNRIISALADVVLVVEARLRSGSLITADFALEQGKSVMALPGRVGDALSEGCNRLIYQGASIAYTPDVVLQEVGIYKRKIVQNKEEAKIRQISPGAQQLYEQLSLTPLSLNDLSLENHWELPQILLALTELEMEQLIMEISPGYYVRRKSQD